MEMIKNIILFTLFWLMAQQVTGQVAWDLGDIGSTDLPQEHICFLTDRDLYLAGETIWFKAYYSCLNKDHLDQLSQILYMELFNANKESVVREKFKITKGEVEGTLAIPPETGSGLYFMRAYTNYQRNFPPESYFMVGLTIINPEVPFQANTSSHEEEIAIIPEGGKLIHGIPSRIAVKVNSDLAGQAEVIQVIDSQQHVITQAAICPNGTGIFSMTPSATHDYSLRILLKRGDTIISPFPEIEDEGFVPSAVRTPTGLTYKVLGNLPSSQAMPHRQLTLCVQSTELVTLAEYPVDLQHMPVYVNIPGSVLHEGIHFFILKDADGNILHVLPVYSTFTKHEIVHIKTDKESYDRRERVNVVLKPGGEGEMPLKVSVSVVKHGTSLEEKVYLPDYVLYNPIILPSYLFFRDVSNDMAEEQADICMILYLPRINTESFKDYMAGYQEHKITSLPEIRDVSLNGEVVDKTSHLPLQDVPLFLSVIDANQIHMYKSNKQGQFIFSLNDLNGIRNLFICPQSGFAEQAEIRIDHDFCDRFPDLINISSPPDSSARGLFEDLWIGAQIESLYGMQAGDIAMPAKAEPSLFGEQRSEVVLSDYIALSSMYEVFWEIVPSVQIRKKKNHYTLSVINDKSEVMDGSLVLLDNIPVYNIDELMKIHPSLVEKIGVINRTYLYGDVVLNGIVSVTTRTDNFAGIKLPEGSVFLEYQTLVLQKNNHFPVYPTPDKRADRQPDFRTLLYWNPNAPIMGGGITLSFYTSDFRGDYDILVRGIGMDGSIYSGRMAFEVKYNKMN
jgi:hypothetical protein